PDLTPPPQTRHQNRPAHPVARSAAPLEPPHPAAQIAALSFKRPADHRDLHSFPPRRSSDLFGPPRRTLVLAASPLDDDRRGQGRSEEHTSELQSQSNLVCRLRLEKKKSPG